VQLAALVAVAEAPAVEFAVDAPGIVLQCRKALEQVRIVDAGRGQSVCLGQARHTDPDAFKLDRQMVGGAAVGLAVGFGETIPGPQRLVAIAGLAVGIRVAGAQVSGVDLLRDGLTLAMQVLDPAKRSDRTEGF